MQYVRKEGSREIDGKKKAEKQSKRSLLPQSIQKHRKETDLLTALSFSKQKLTSYADDTNTKNEVNLSRYRKERNGVLFVVLYTSEGMAESLDLKPVKNKGNSADLCLF